MTLRLLLFLLISSTVLQAQDDQLDIRVLDMNPSPEDPALPEFQFAVEGGYLIQYPTDKGYQLNKRIYYYDGKAIRLLDLSDYPAHTIVQRFREGFIFRARLPQGGASSFFYYDLPSNKSSLFFTEEATDISYFLVYGDLLIWRARGNKLMRSGGTVQSTFELPFPDRLFQSPRLNFILRDTLYFSVGERAYLTDAKPAGAFEFSNVDLDGAVVYKEKIYIPNGESIRVSAGFGQPFSYIRLSERYWTTGRISLTAEGMVFITQVREGSGSALYRSDGTQSGTVEIGNTRDKLLAPDSDQWVVDGHFFALTASPRGSHYLYESDGTHEGTYLVDADPLSKSYANDRWIDAKNNAIFHIGDRYFVYSADLQGRRTRSATTASGENVSDRSYSNYPLFRHMGSHLVLFRDYQEDRGINFELLSFESGRLTTHQSNRKLRPELFIGQVGNKGILTVTGNQAVRGSNVSFALFDPEQQDFTHVRPLRRGLTGNLYTSKVMPPVVVGEQTVWFGEDFYYGQSLFTHRKGQNNFRVGADIHPYTADSRTFQDWAVSSNGRQNDRLFTEAYGQLHHYKLGSEHIDTFANLNKFKEIIGFGGDYMYFHTAEDFSQVQALNLTSGEIDSTGFRNGLDPGAFTLLGEEIFYLSVDSKRNDPHGPVDTLIVKLQGYNPITKTRRLVYNWRSSPFSSDLYAILRTDGNFLYFVSGNDKHVATLHRSDGTPEGTFQVSELDIKQGNVNRDFFPAGDVVFVTRKQPGNNNGKTDIFLVDVATGVYQIIAEGQIQTNTSRANTIITVAGLPDYYLLNTSKGVLSINRADKRVEVLDDKRTRVTKNVYFSKTNMNTVVYYLETDGVNLLRETDGTSAGTRTIYQDSREFFWHSNAGTSLIQTTDEKHERRLMLFDHSRRSTRDIDLQKFAGSHNPVAPRPFGNGFVFLAQNDLLGFEPHLLNVDGFNDIIADVSIPDESGLLVFPNPTAGSIYVRSGLTVTVTAKIYDLQGRQLLMSLLTAGEGTIEFGSFPPAVYVLVIHDQHGRHIGRTRIVRK